MKNANFVIGLVTATVIYLIAGYIYTRIMKNRPVSLIIKTQKIGNEHYPIRTIKEIVVPNWEIFKLTRQVEDLQKTVNEIVSIITLGQLEEFYSTNDIVQRGIDAFSDNFQELGTVCSECRNKNVSVLVFEGAIREVYKDNDIILSKLHGFLKTLLEYVRFQEGNLFNVHSHEVDFNFEKDAKAQQATTELKADQQERSRKEKEFLEAWGEKVGE